MNVNLRFFAFQYIWPRVADLIRLFRRLADSADEKVWFNSPELAPEFRAQGFPRGSYQLTKQD